jgi:hypothetical protein
VWRCQAVARPETPAPMMATRCFLDLAAIILDGDELCSLKNVRRIRIVQDMMVTGLSIVCCEINNHVLNARIQLQALHCKSSTDLV